MDHKVSKDMISSGMIPSGEKTQADLGRTQYGSAPSPSKLMDAYKSMYEHHQKDKDGNTIPHEGEEVKEENINELKTRTMLNYIDKASDSASKQLDKANKTTSRKKEVKARLKMDSRERGIEMAKDKIMRRVKEETISEAGARVGRKFSMGKVGKQYGRDEYGDPIKKDGSSALKKNVDKNPKDDKTPNTLMGEAKSPAWQRRQARVSQVDSMQKVLHHIVLQTQAQNLRLRLQPNHLS